MLHDENGDSTSKGVDPILRLMPIFGLVAAPVVCRLLAESWDNYDPRRDHPIVNGVLVAIAGLLCVGVFPNAGAIEQQIAAREPVAALGRIQESKLKGPMLNDYAWGGYLIWSNPAQPVFVDGRADVFAWTGVLRAYGRWAQLQDDPRQLLDRYGIQTCLIHATAPMARVLPYLPGWKQVYADKLAVVYTRVSNEYRAAF